jgi:molybdate transport system substrate-binding protein
LSELMDVPGVEVVGPLPSEIQEITEFTGAICEPAAPRAAAKALLVFCASSLADATKRSYGMEP